MSVVRLAALLTGLTLLSACSTLKASPATDAGFVPKPKLLVEARDRAPFHGYWVYDSSAFYALRKSYGKVYIAPVDTSLVEQSYSLISARPTFKRMRVEQVQEIARYFREKLKLEFGNRQNPLLQVVEHDGEHVLTLHIALTELVPTNPGINAVGTIAGIFVPGGGLLRFAGEGSVAMEGFVDEAVQHRPLYAEFKDREGQKTSPFSVKDYQQWAHARVTLDEWAMQIVELLSTPGDQTVDDSDTLELDPF